MKIPVESGCSCEELEGPHAKGDALPGASASGRWSLEKMQGEEHGKPMGNIGENTMEVPPNDEMDGLFHGKCHLEMDDLGVPPF